MLPWTSLFSLLFSRYWVDLPILNVSPFRQGLALPIDWSLETYSFQAGSVLKSHFIQLLRARKLLCHFGDFGLATNLTAGAVLWAGLEGALKLTWIKVAPDSKALLSPAIDLHSGTAIIAVSHAHGFNSQLESVDFNQNVQGSIMPLLCRVVFNFLRWKPASGLTGHVYMRRLLQNKLYRKCFVSTCASLLCWSILITAAG